MGVAAYIWEKAKGIVGAGKPKNPFLEIAESYAENVVAAKGKGALSEEKRIAEKKAFLLNVRIAKKLDEIRLAEAELEKKRKERQTLAAEVMALPQKVAKIKMFPIEKYRAEVAAIEKEINDKAADVHEIDLEIARLERKIKDKPDLQAAHNLLSEVLPEK